MTNHANLDSKAPLEDLRGAISSLDSLVKERSGATRDISRASVAVIDAGKRLACTPEGHDILVEAMLCNGTRQIRDAARLALVDSPNERVEKAYRLDSILTQFGNCHFAPFGEVINEPKNVDALAEELKAMVNDPVFVKRMIDYMLSRRSFAEKVALAVRETPLPEMQASIRAMIEEKIGDQWEFSTRDDMQYLPYALDAAVPANRKLLTRVLNEGRSSFHGNFERAAILALGEAKTPQAAEFVRERFFTEKVYPAAQAVPVAQSLKEHLTEENEATLVSLVDGSRMKTAWIMAAFGGAGGIAQMWGALRLLAKPAVIDRKRTEAALALCESHPQLAQRVLAAIDRDRSESAKQCRADLGSEIQWSLGRLQEAARSEAAGA